MAVNTFQFYFFLWVRTSGYWRRYMDQVFEAATTGGVLNTRSCHSGLIFEPEIPTRYVVEASGLCHIFGG
jgi:hypothetical protein